MDLGRRKAVQGDGRYAHETASDIRGPNTIKTGAAVLPANDTDSHDAKFLVAPSGETPFDNGSTDYRVLAVATDGVNGLRCSWGQSADLASLVNEVAITGTTGATSTLSHPCPTIDLNGHAAWKTAAKRVFYINGAVANTDSSRLRSLVLDDDNNRTGSGDAAVNSGLCSATATDFNNKLVGLCYAKVDGRALNSGPPMSYTYSMIAIFEDGSGNQSLGYIYGSSFATLSVAKISLTTNFSTSFDTIIQCVPLVKEMGKPVYDKLIGGLPLLVTGDNGSSARHIFMTVSGRSMYSFVTKGNSFFQSSFGTARASNFQFRSSEAVNKYLITIEEDDGSTNAEQNTYYFIALGSESDDRGAATVLA